MSFEYAILKYINKHFKNSFFDKLLYIATKMGDFGGVWIITAVLMLCFEKTRKWGLVFSFGFLFATILGNLILKPIFGRKRPCDDPAIELALKRPVGYSFPSGHTLTSFTAGTIIFAINFFAGTLAFIIAVLISFSRMYFYVHYPSDVFGGAILGIIIGCVSVKIGGALLW